ncbi:MAG TPA: TIGR03435 family protein [Vicinamibacterales bacterium]|nr:TIGR03435 family protein [Vicinamibacterales bacterium]
MTIDGLRRVLAVVAVVAVTGCISVSTQSVQSDATSVPDRPGFEVASVRPVLKDNPRRGLIDDFADAEMAKIGLMQTAQKGRFRTSGFSVHTLIQLAYDVKGFQIDGGPSWVRSDRFEIEARTAGPASAGEVRGMFRSLLADRFRLMVRLEARTMPVYELVAARGGLKIAPLKDGECITLNEKMRPIPMDLAKPTYICGGVRRKVVTLPPERMDRIEAGGIAMSWLVDMLADDVGRTVIDRTGFTEPFNLLLDFAPHRDLAVDSGASSAPTIFTAIEEQLGLRLRATTGPVDVVVIERVERPSEN